MNLIAIISRDHINKPRESLPVLSSYTTSLLAFGIVGRIITLRIKAMAQIPVYHTFDRQHIARSHKQTTRITSGSTDNGHLYVIYVFLYVSYQGQLL